MIRIHEPTNNNTENELDLSKHILKFIRLRQINQFEERSKAKFKTCNKSCIVAKETTRSVLAKLNDRTGSNNQDEEDQMEVDNDDSDFDSDSEAKHSKKSPNLELMDTTWLSVWNRIVFLLNETRLDDIQCYLETNTDILHLHIKYNINLDMKCFSLLTNCIKPSLIEKLFNKSLIHPNDQNHFFCIHERQILFNALQTGLYTNHSSEPSLILMSLTIFLYKTKCSNQKQKLLATMNKKLCPFLFREQYEENFRTIVVKHFIKCVYLNGVFTSSSLSKFLTSTSRTTGSNQENRAVDDEDDDEELLSDSDTDEWPVDEDDDEDEDEDDSDEDIGVGHRNLHLHQQHLRRRANDDQNNQNRNQSVKSVGDLIKLSPEESKLGFPLSLKNMSRIAIKNCMKEFTPRSVDKLYILPNVLRRFLLFQDEIDAILNIRQSTNDTTIMNALSTIIRLRPRDF